LLLEQAERLQQTIKAVEELMNAHRDGIQLSAEEQVEIFGTTAFGSEYAAEAEERWGETDAWKQSQQRVSQLRKQDWIAVKTEGDALLADLAQAKRDGVVPGSTTANELAARHRASIERFYDCGDEMHRNLAEMYLADERFTRYYDDVEPGLAQFVHDIVVASIDR
jgi:kynureninase